MRPEFVSTPVILLVVTVILASCSGSDEKGERMLFLSVIRPARADPLRFEIGDLNRDGKDDLVLNAIGNNGELIAGVRVLLGGPLVSMARHGPFDEIPTEGIPLLSALVDVDDDGILDIVVREQDDGQTTVRVRIIYGDGNGDFDETTVLTDAANGSVFGDVAAADFTSDGMPDLFVSTQGEADRNGTVYVAVGDRQFVRGPAVPLLPIQSTIGLADGVDVDGDTLADVVFLTSFGVFVATGNGDASFEFQDTSDKVLSGGLFSIADLNHDGMPDLLSETRVALNLGDGEFSLALLPRILGSRYAVGDLNGDRLPDLLVHNSDEFSVLVNVGGGTFHDLPDSRIHFDGLPQLGDFNGDGELDIAAANDQTGIRLIPGLGGARFPQFSEIRVDQNRFFLSSDTTLVHADLDGDGDPDVIANGFASGDSPTEVVVYRNEAYESYTESTVLTSTRNHIQHVVADINGDNKPDILVEDLQQRSRGATSHFERISIFLNAGDMEFIPMTPFVPSDELTFVSRSLHVANLNGDALLDLVWEGFSTVSGTIPVLKIIFQTEAGDFEEHGVIALSDAALDVEVFDVDGDSHTDISLQLVDVEDLLVYLNDGTGSFNGFTPIPFGLGSEFGSFHAVDIDADGLVDVAIRSTRRATYLNEGNLSFSLVEEEIDHEIDGFNSLFADVDLDGNLDEVSPDVFVHAQPGAAGSAIQVRRGVGDGTFGPGTLYGFVFPEIDGTSIVDATGDGYPDVVSWSGASLLIMENALPSTDIRHPHRAFTR